MVNCDGGVYETFSLAIEKLFTRASIMSDNFFREVTCRICGSLNIDEALYDLFLYLKNKLPLNAILFSLYDRNQKVTRLIALAYENGGFLMDLLVPLSDAASNAFSQWQQSAITENTPWFRDHTSSINIEVLKVGRQIYPELNDHFTEKYCSITCALKIKNRIIGQLTFVSEGVKPYDQSHADLIEDVNEPLALALSNALSYLNLVQDHRALKKDTQKFRSNVMIGANTGLREVAKLIEGVAITDSPVLIIGETGTGKEVVANEIHKLSKRSNGPLVILNCGAIPESLIDSELFGHEKGAFTGAIEMSPGRFERANGGTLFLDEIGELPHMAQVKLLRVLQTGEFERVGGKRTIFSDARIIAATHRQLDKMITDGGFRQDLMYRLNVFPINIPPLRERRQDIETLVDYFIRKKSEEMNLPHRPPLAVGALEILRAYNWPGNVRELQNIVERSLILSRGEPLHFMELNARQSSSINHNSDPSLPIIQLDKTITRQIQLALEQTWGKISGPDGAAELLGLHPNTLRSKMKKLGIHTRKNNIS